MKRIMLFAVAVALLAFGATASGCAEAPPGEDQPLMRTEPITPGEDAETIDPEGPQVEMRDLAFTPRFLEIRVGDTVTWRNADRVPHTVTGSGLDSGQLAQGESYEFTFTEVGQYEYGCSIHPGMQGVVVVR